MILPPVDEHFAWRETAFGPALVCRPLEQVARHLFTTRRWSLGAAPSSPTAWCEPAEALGVPPGSLVRLKQVHGHATVVAEQLTREVGALLPEADIVLSRDASLAVAVQAADCVPLLVADERLGVVAAAHAGWRGLAQGVPAKVVADLERTYGSRPADLVAAIGPSVGACCYEVGADVIQAFADAGFSEDGRARWFVDAPMPSPRNPSMRGIASSLRPGHAFFDGWSCTRDQLRAAGVPKSRIFSPTLCSASHEEWLCSYRRDKQAAGRMVGVIRARARE